jgi:phospho-N-acetylmuramoyl-pentapeptide-transferase
LLAVPIPPLGDGVILAQLQPSAINIMVRGLGLGALSFILSFVIGIPLIALLRRKRIGKQIRIDGPESHQIKMGTPTMGGIMITGSMLVITAAFNMIGRWSMLLPMGVVVGSGVLGAIDDLLCLSGGSRKGITARFKSIWLLLIAGVAAVILHYSLGLTSVYIPLAGKFDIGIWYLPIAVFIIFAEANAVNLTDGLDTLGGGIAAVAFAVFGVIAFLQGQDYVVPLCFTVVGGLLAFLWFNAHPAQVFMGDTGSLALGSLLGVAALMTGQWLLLPIVGVVFVAEALSVLLQVAYFKFTGGKRLFKMAPLHHHFELMGWSETQVTMRFWLIAMLAGMLGVALALL